MSERPSRLRQLTFKGKAMFEDQKEDFGEIKTKKLDFVEQMTDVSGASKGSSTASQKRAKAEAEKVRLQYVKKENELMKQKAALEADISVIKQESIVAAAETEARVLEQGDHDDQDVISALGDTKQKITIDYVQSLQLPKATQQITEPIDSQPPQMPTTANVQNNPDTQGATLTTAMSGISSLIYRKDFLLSRFSKFDDKPETYESWRASFQSITRELDVSPFEEMDLLVKWLGPESSKFATSIRAANAHDPPKGLQRIYERLHDRYGRPEMVENALKRKLDAFPPISSKDNTKLYDLLDIITEIESVMLNPQYQTLLSYYNSSSGVRPIVSKLPNFMQEKWTNVASSYKKSHAVIYPPFSVFVTFIRDTCEIRNDPAFSYVNTSQPVSYKPRTSVVARRLDITSENSIRCPLHKAGHSLNDCRGFRKMAFQDRKKFLREKKICFKCCQSNQHISSNCTASVKCQVCGNNRHPTALHIHVDRLSIAKDESSKGDGGEPVVDSITTKCTTLCGNLRVGRSCGKTVLVDVYNASAPDKKIRVYAAIDDQSNRTLASPDLLDKLGIEGKTAKFDMSSCSGKSTMTGRIAKGINVKSVTNNNTFELPDVIECACIPSDLPEIATPDVASAHSHLSRISQYLPQLDPNVKVELLIGRDIPEVHHVNEQILGGKGQPFAQNLPLGWVIIGEVCLGKVHAPSTINVRRTHVLSNGRNTTFPLCEYNIEVSNSRDIQDDIFVKTPNDNKIGFSVEDKQFISLMENSFKQDDTGYWTAPLPFKQPKPPVPNNRPQAWKRAQILDSSLRKNKVKQDQFLTFMDKVLKSGAAEKAPTTIHDECWYLPLFGVYHPRKPNEIRGVFDSSAVYEGVSLNSLLMSGPDLTNNLVGILMRFRLNEVAITGDVEQMFYRFRVTDDHRDYLRFFWYQNNDISQPLIEYRMTSHVFGNTPSPAVATYGLRLAVSNSDDDVKCFISRDFYVDDGLTSVVCADQAINLVKKTQKDLQNNGHIRFHKIVSNNIDVMKAFPNDDLGKNLKDVDLCHDILPTHRSLGISWNLQSDNFVFQHNNDDKPATRRGMLSTINSLFDPLGFISPITISGKILLRQVIPPGTDWDEPLSPEHEEKWNLWSKSLQSIDSLEIPRMIAPISFSSANHHEIHIFCDASEQAISAVAYLKVGDDKGVASVGFLMGKSKLAPVKGHTIPRLELCGAVLATELGETICEHLSLPHQSCHYYTDSKVALGYICNTTRRFFNYVSNRVEKIHKVSKPSQWSFVTTDKNPADLGTRFVTTTDMTLVSKWINGPHWLVSENNYDIQTETYPLIAPNEDKEIRSEVVSLKTSVSNPGIGSHRFSRFSTWKSLVRAISCLKRFIQFWKSKRNVKKGATEIDQNLKKQTEIFIIRQVQGEVYGKETENLREQKPIQKSSTVLKLDPFIDDHDILRVGGRLKYSDLSVNEKNPILIPGSHYIAKLLTLHCHELIKHQGRHLTEGRIRSEGFWITGAKRLVYSAISKCVLCKRFRANTNTQKMSDLPEERLKTCSPFTYVGIDCFGPWEVVTRRTRGGSANSKRWAVLFCCLSSRAVHIEVIEEMSTSSFINALRRFLAIRGKVKEFFSDRGTNFTGAVKELGIPAFYVEDKSIRSFLSDQGTVWKFNTPFSSHMGGSWERLIGIARRIIDSLLYEFRHKRLTHEVLCTFMAETTAIMNSRPLVSISSDSQFPTVLSPNSLLTTKSEEPVEDFSNLDIRDVYTSQWKLVQKMAEQFWSQWRHHYLQTLQPRRKWQQTQTNIREGDIVILKEQDQHRNFWPLAIIEHVFPSKDSHVRKVLLRTTKDGQSRVYVRPITQTILLSQNEL